MSTQFKEMAEFTNEEMGLPAYAKDSGAKEEIPDPEETQEFIRKAKVQKMSEKDKDDMLNKALEMYEGEGAWIEEEEIDLEKDKVTFEDIDFDVPFPEEKKNFYSRFSAAVLRREHATNQQMLKKLVSRKQEKIEIT